MTALVLLIATVVVGLIYFGLAIADAVLRNAFAALAEAFVVLMIVAFLFL